MNYYIGQAIDIHNLIKKKSIVSLGGYQFQTEYKIVADSDGDVVLHAIANSILGALGKGDIGKYFKKSDFEKKRSSIKIIKFVLSELSKEKKVIQNIDLTILCEKIIISKIRKNIIKSIIDLINCNKVNVKATRWENKSDMRIGCTCSLLLKGN